jgi:hypothetical protein
MIVLLAAGVALRLLATVAYRPALIYIDSVYAYLNPLHSLDPSGPDPLGYDILLLRPVLAAGDLRAVVVVQHLLGLAMAVAIYLVLAALGTRRWLAAVATAPALIDAYQVQIEQNVMSDTLFQALLVAAIGLLAWRGATGWRVAAATGALLGMATVTRLAGALVIVAALGYAGLTNRGVRRLLVPTAMIVGFAAPVVAYATYYHHATGRFALTDSGGAAGYGRVATFADCRGVEMPAYERVLCPAEPRALRRGPDYYAHDPRSPQFRLVPPEGKTSAQVMQDFAARIVIHQPVDLVRAVAGDAVKLFSWTRTDDANPDAPTERWRFQTTYPTFPAGITLNLVASLGDRYGGGDPVVVRPLAAILRGYQISVGYTPGPILVLAILAALLAGVVARRRAGAALLFLAAGALVLLFADSFEFTWRYQLPALVLLPAAGALGMTALLHRPSDARPSDARTRFPEPADRAALAGFAARYGGAVRFPPVVVLIAAFNEAEALGGVLASIPPTCLGVQIATLVVVDGGGDDTARVALRRSGYPCPVHVCVTSVNRGQGAALRLGYHLVREGGAAFVVTTDADGQYDMAQLPLLLEPLLSGAADFVTGSRRLGVDRSSDRVRRAGVRVFAWLVSILTRHPITDTSFGFRAMTARLTGEVTLEQPQYQACELLIEVISRGYRIAERPMTMRVRAGGRTKKGGNLRYGLRYARVVFSSWARNTQRSSSRNLTRNISA